MDFSNFSNDEEIYVTENTRILVVDFVNRQLLYSASINNYQKIDTTIVKEINENVQKNIENYKKSPNYIEKSKKVA